MANTVTRTILVDGPRHAVVHLFVASDGVAGELTDAIAVDASALSGSPTDLTLESIWADAAGFSGVFEWDATADVGLWVVATDDCSYHDFRSFGGIPNSAGAGKTGDIVLTTTGFTAAGDAGSFILKVKKD